MQLEYETIEDSMDETTHIRTITEQAAAPGQGWLLRTTIYTPHHISSDVTFIPAAEDQDTLFDGIHP